MTTQKIAIGIIAKNESLVLPSTLQSIIDLDYPKSAIHLFFVDGDSTDGTMETFVSMVEKNQLGYTAYTESMHKPASGYDYGHSHARNIIVQNIDADEYKYICRLDADCLVDKHWLATLVKKMEDTSEEMIAGGGGMRLVDASEGKTNRELLFNYYITNKIASLNNPAFVETRQKYIASIAGYNSIYKTAVLKRYQYETGYPFNTDDISINFFIKRDGFKFLYIPKAKIYHGMVDSIPLFFKMMVNYGKGSMFMSLKYKKLIRLYTLIAVGYLGHLITLPFYLGNTLTQILRTVPTIVLILLGAIIGRQIKQKNNEIRVATCLILPIVNVVGYGWGSLMMARSYKKVKRD